MTITGHKELDRKLAKLGGPVARKVCASGVRAGLGVVRKAIREEVPVASVRKVVASRFKRRTKKSALVAKVGAGVGKHKTKQVAKRSRPGVGIGKQNAHWYFLGTSTRATRRGANRGRMPQNDAVRRGFSKSRALAVVAMLRKMREQIEREAKKLR